MPLICYPRASMILRTCALARSIFEWRMILWTHTRSATKVWSHGLTPDHMVTPSSASTHSCDELHPLSFTPHTFATKMAFCPDRSSDDSRLAIMAARDADEPHSLITNSAFRGRDDHLTRRSPSISQRQKRCRLTTHDTMLILSLRNSECSQRRLERHGRSVLVMVSQKFGYRLDRWLYFLPPSNVVIPTLGRC